MYSIKKTDTIPTDEFRIDSVGLGCFSNKTFEHSGGYLRCLRIGSINIKMKQNEVEKMLKDPVKIIENDDGQTFIYLLPTSEEYYPYLAITYKKKKVLSIQLTGFSTTSDFSFSSITLGTHYKKVLEILGKPHKITKVPDINGLLWDYTPFPFSIEFVNKKVYSIKVSDIKE